MPKPSEEPEAPDNRPEPPPKSRKAPRAIPTEAPEAAEIAWLDYFDLGPHRSLKALHQLYLERAQAGGQVPTVRFETIEKWSGDFDWVNRCKQRMHAIAESALEKMSERRVEFAEQRIKEARGTHVVAGAIVQEIIRRVQAGELQKLSLVGYWTSIPFQTELIEQDWELCPAVGCALITGVEDPDCLVCGGTGRKMKGTGRRKVQAGTKVVKVEGLMDYAQVASRMVEVGQRLERLELGEDKDDTKELINAILSLLPEQLRAEVSAGIAAALATGSAGGHSRSQPSAPGE